MKIIGLRKNLRTLLKIVLVATYFFALHESAQAADTGRFVGGDLKVDGILFSADSSVIRKVSDLSGPWTLLDTNLYYLAGNVGIGSMTPAAKLSVASSGAFLGDFSTSSSYGYLRLAQSGSARFYLGFGNAGNILANALASSTSLWAASGALHLTANVDAIQGITVLPSGYVGINSTAPTHKLHVIDLTVGNSDNPAIYGEHASTDNWGVGVYGKGGFKGVMGTVTGGGSGNYYGVQGSATSTNATAGSAIGGIFEASGALHNYGIYSAAAKNYLSGSLGIGTTTPGARLHLKGNDYPDSFMYIDTNAVGQDSGIRLYENGVVGAHLFWAAAAQSLRLYGKGYSGLDITSLGNVGIGTTAPTEKLHVWGRYIKVQGLNSEQAYIGGDGAGGDVQVGSMNAAVTNVAMYNTATSTYMSVYLKDVHVMGGADIAEPFNSVDADRLKPGMVMSIDSKNPGQLILADTAYDTKVAGIVSGANGIKAGMTMSQEGTVASGSVPVALSGRVYAWADASYGAINPGDLLTTSDKPGHAMKVTEHGRAQGAIIGKAMSGLSEGTGLILVLVSLQ